MLQYFGRSWFLCLSGLVTIISFFFLSYLPLPIVEQSMLRLQLAFTPVQFQNVIDILGQSGIDDYLKFIWLDYIFPIGYGSFFGGCLVRLFQKTTKMSAQKVLWLPIVAVCCDYIENSLHIVILSKNIFQHASSLIFTAAVIASVKWTVSLAMLLIILGLIFRYFFIKFKGRS